MTVVNLALLFSFLAFLFSAVAMARSGGRRGPVGPVGPQGPIGATGVSGRDFSQILAGSPGNLPDQGPNQS